jgi:hypothetical protein
LNRVTSSRSGVTSLVPLAHAVQGKHATMSGFWLVHMAQQKRRCQVLSNFFFQCCCCCRHFLLNMPSLLRCVSFQRLSAITAGGSQKMDSQAKKLQSVLFLNFRPHTHRERACATLRKEVKVHPFAS